MRIHAGWARKSAGVLSRSYLGRQAVVTRDKGKYVMMGHGGKVRRFKKVASALRAGNRLLSKKWR